jgi:hypothetical protein
MAMSCLHFPCFLRVRSFARCPRTTSFLMLVWVALVFLASSAIAQGQLQYNVPYRCPDGSYLIVTRCALTAAGQKCYWTPYHQNGQQSMEQQFTPEAQLESALGRCKADTSAAGAATAKAANTPDLATLVTTPTGRISTGLNPAYLNGLPAVEVVKQVIQGSDPTDTLARQVAVFNTLSARIQHHLANNNHSFSFSPDEVKVKYAYDLASYQIEQEYKKTHTPAEANAFIGRHNRLESDFGIDKVIDTELLSATAVAENRTNDTQAFRQLKEHNELTEKEQQEAIAKAQAAARETPGQASNDPTAVAIRRCLEMGGNELECVGKGMYKGMFGLIGVDSDDLAYPNGRPVGLVLEGTYGQAGAADLAFTDTTVRPGCTALDANTSSYSITKQGASLMIQVANQPRSYTVVLSADGTMKGPGTVDVAGRIVTGYRHYTVVDHRTSDWQIVGQHEVTEPIYQATIKPCNMGTNMHLRGPVAVGTLSNLLSGALAAAGGDKSGGGMKTYPGGPRMEGIYQTPGGLQMTFAPEAVVLDCGSAHAARSYTVETLPAAMRITIAGEAPVTVALQPNGTLSGSGTATVSGRVISGQAPGAGVTYRPVQASCPVSTLAPQQPKKSGGLLSGR